MNKRRRCWVWVVLSGCALLAGCGGATTPTPDFEAVRSAVTVSISPDSAVISNTQTVQFTAAVTGTANTAVTWSVSGAAGSNVGTISPSGVYNPTGVTTSQVVTVTATSVANPQKSASAQVTVMAPGQVSSTQNLQVAQYSLLVPRDATVQVEFGPDTSYGLNTWAVPTPSGGGLVSILVAGMRAFTTYHMRADVTFADGVQYQDSDHTFATGGLPANRLPQVTVTEPSAGLTPNPGIELLDLISSYPVVSPAAFDLQGNLIWYYDTDPNGSGAGFPSPIKPLPNGHMKMAVAGVVPDTGSQVVREIDLAGNVISEFSLAALNAALQAAGYPIIAQGFHHDFALLPNGHTVYLVHQRQTFPDLGSVLGDALVDVDRFNRVKWAWSSFDHLDVHATMSRSMGFPDWTHSNAVVYSPSDGNLLLSSRSLSWVFKIDYANGTGNGDVLWKLGPGGDFNLTNGGASDWFYNQHFPIFLSPNTSGAFTLGLFDNGNSRPDPNTGLTCGTQGAAACYSRGIILNIDETARTAQIAFNDPLPLFAFCCGNFGVLGNGNIEIGAGVEYPQPPSFVFEVDRASLKTVWQLSVNNNLAYRAFRIPSLYPGVQW
jgi:arylsulfate sulfotransferase